MPSTLDYASVDPNALGPDEALWYEWVAPARTNGCAAAFLRFMIGLAFAGIVGLAVGGLKGKSSVAIGTCVVIIGTGLAALWGLHALRVRRGFRVRVTDRRIFRQGKGESHVTGCEHRELKVLVLSHGGAASGTEMSDSTETDDGVSEELISVAREGMAEIKLVGECPQPFRRAMFRALSNGICQRHADRRSRWTWKPRQRHIMEQVSRESWVTPVIENEVVLWCGEPTVNWRREYRNLAVGWLRSSYWTIGAAGLVALPVWLPATRNGGVITLAVIASIVLIAQAYRYAVTPIQTHRRLAQTRYALTNWRIVVSVPSKSGRAETSYFIDSSSRVEIEENGPWGSVKIGLLTFEQLSSARELYDIATRTIATCRWSEPANSAIVGEPVPEMTAGPVQEK